MTIENLNYLTERERVEIVSTFNVIHDSGSFNCNKCKERHTEETRNSRKGCSKPTAKPFAQWRKEIKYLRCPVNFYRGDIANLIDSFRLFERGQLPYNGGLFDQPNKIIEVYSLVESLKLEYQKDQYDKQNKAQSRMSKAYGQ